MSGSMLSNEAEEYLGVPRSRGNCLLEIPVGTITGFWMHIGLSPFMETIPFGCENSWSVRLEAS